MVSNLSQVLNLLNEYLELHFGKHFSMLLKHAENVKCHESNNKADKHKYQFGELSILLARDFGATQTEINELSEALAKGIDHFHNQFVKKLLDTYEKPNLFKEIEDDIVIVSKELQKTPYNYHSADFINCLRIGILFNIHHDLYQFELGDHWSALSEQFDPQYLKDGPESIYGEYCEIIVKKWASIYVKYKDDPSLSIYVLHLIRTLPYQASVN